MDIKRHFCRQRKEEVWDKISREIGGKIIKGKEKWDGDKIVAKAESWVITLDYFTEPYELRTLDYTRLRCPISNKEGFRFTIYREEILVK